MYRLDYCIIIHVYVCVMHCFDIIFWYIYLASIFIYLVHVVYQTLQLKQPPLVVSNVVKTCLLNVGQVELSQSRMV